MVVNKTKKFRKYRGSKTHGGGAKKKRRGAGSRGGRGMAGSGKRADQKKPSIINEYGNSYFGRRGFRNKSMKAQEGINVNYIDSHLDLFVKQKKAKLDNNIYEISLFDIGYNKLLGSGKISKKVKIIADFASAKAIEKVKQSGGEVILPTKSDEQ